MKRTIEQINEEMVRIEMNIMQEKERIGELREEAMELTQREFEEKHGIKSGYKITASIKYKDWLNNEHNQTFDCFYIGFCLDFNHINMVYADVKKDGTISKNTHKTVSYNDYTIKKAE